MFFEFVFDWKQLDHFLGTRTLLVSARRLPLLLLRPVRLQAEGKGRGVRMAAAEKKKAAAKVFEVYRKVLVTSREVVAVP